MSILYSYIREEWVEATGWALLHSLWQGTIILLLLLIVLFLFRKISAQVRYLIACSSLIASLLWAGITFNNAWNYAHEKQLLKEKLVENPAEITKLLVGSLSTETVKTQQAQSVNFNVVRLRAFLQRHFPEMFLLWFCGIFIFFLRLSGGMLYLFKLRNRQTMPLGLMWINILNNYTEKLGLKQKFEALQSSLVKVPMVIGHIKPVILLPVSLFTGLNQKEIEAIIVHELAHIKRYDYLLNIIQSVIEILFFFHPAIWFISKIIRDEREHSCDDLAVRATGDKLNYMKALASTQQMVFNTNSMYAVAFAKKHSLIFHRINRIKNLRTMKNNVTEGFIAATFIFISLILLSFTFDGQNLKSDSFYSPGENVDNNLVIAATAKLHQKFIVKKQPKAMRDTVRVKIEQLTCNNDSLPKEMEQIIEIALSEEGDGLSRIIIHSIDSVMNCVNISKTIERAMFEADSSLKHIEIDIDVNTQIADAKIEIEQAKKEMEKAKKELECNKGNLEESKEVMKQIKIIMDSIKIDTIVNNAMKEVKIMLESDEMQSIIDLSIKTSQEALAKIDFDKIVHDAIESEHGSFPNDEESVIIHKEIIEKEPGEGQESEEKQMEEKLKELEKE